jgi:hypothetical protein
VTLSASVTEKPISRRAWQAALAYLGITAFCLLFDAVYSLYGHGVSSPFMDYMFLYPLLGGALPFGLAWAGARALSGRHSRFFFNCFNSGIAALTTASLIRGICQIAGTQAPQTGIMAAAGWAMALTGFLGYLIRVLWPAPSNSNISKEMIV